VNSTHIKMHGATIKKNNKNLYDIFLILRRIQRDITVNVHKSSCKVSIIYVRS